MNWPKLFIATVVLIATAVFIYTWKTSPGHSPYEMARDSLEIQFGPIRHSELPPTLIDRIRLLEKVFAEVYPITHEEWLDGFQRDQNPENEVAIWEDMATAYTKFTSENDLDFAAKREVFAIILVRSRNSDIDPQLSSLQHLTIEEGKQLVALYRADPKPVTITIDP